VDSENQDQYFAEPEIDVLFAPFQRLIITTRWA